jgi:hypothetical protein
MVLCRQARKPQKIIGHLRARATRQLKANGLWLDLEQPVLGQAPGWSTSTQGSMFAGRLDMSSRILAKKESRCSSGRLSRRLTDELQGTLDARPASGAAKQKDSS